MMDRQRNKHTLLGLVGALLMALALVGGAPAPAFAADAITEGLAPAATSGEVAIDEPLAALDAQGGAATASAAGTFSAPVSATVSYTKAWQVLDLVNQQRAAQGLSALTMDQDLLNAAMQRAAETTVVFSHTRPDGTQCYTAAPNKMSGENIAMGTTTASTTMDMWMNSQGHRANILGTSWTSIGIGCVQASNGAWYWVQCFGAGTPAAASKGSYADGAKTYQVNIAPDALGIDYDIVSCTSDRSTTITPATKFAPGGTQRYAFVIDQSSSYGLIPENQVTWASSNPAVATVDADGLVTFKASGSVTITATTTGGLSASTTINATVLAAGQCPVFRVYNPNSGLHHYTINQAEREYLVSLGWNDEGTSFFVAQSQGTPVYREYNPNDGTHNWTTSKGEHDYVVRAGWNNEGIGWYMPSGATVNVYRLYNPNSGEHVYTTSKGEYDAVVKAGWRGEGVGWKSL